MRVSVRAARPREFRAEALSEGGGVTLSTGTQWVRYEPRHDFYRLANVSRRPVSELFPVLRPEAAANAGRVFASLWLGKHSLRRWLLDGGRTCKYKGVEVVDGVELHRIDSRTKTTLVSLFLSVGEPPLPMRCVSQVDSYTITPTGSESLSQQALQTEIVFSGWKLDPPFAEDAFLFVPPRGAAVSDWPDWTPLPIRRGEVMPAAIAALPDMQERLAVTLLPPEKGGSVRSQELVWQDALPAVCGASTQAGHIAAMRKSFVAYLRRQYRSHGRSDAQWDRAVVDFHTRWAEASFGEWCPIRLVELRQQAVRIRSLGCRDPVIGLHAAGAIRRPQGNAADRPMSAEWEALCRSSYPQSMKLVLLSLVTGLGEGLCDERPEFWEEYVRTWPAIFSAAAAETAFSGGNQRLFLQFSERFWDGMDLNAKAQALEQMAALPDSDPWLAAYYAGRYHLDTANSISPDNPALAGETEATGRQTGHSRAGQADLTRAWELHPEFPEAPTRLIGLGGTQETRNNFDRATAAQIDWQPAYDALRQVYAKRERATDLVYQLGLDAADTARYDSGAPEQLWECLVWLTRKGESWQDVMARPGTLAALRKVCQGYLATDSPPNGHRYWRTAWLVGCWAAGNGQEALGVLRDLEFSPDFVCEYSTPGAAAIVAEVLLLASPRGRELAQALLDLRNKQYGMAIPVLRETMLAARHSQPRVYVHLGNLLSTVPFSQAQEQANMVLDAMVEVHRREAVVQSFVLWDKDAADQIPNAFRERVKAHLGPICWVLMEEAPTEVGLPQEEVARRSARLDALAMAYVVGGDERAKKDTEALLASELALAKLRLHYCLELGPQAAEQLGPTHVRKDVAPIIGSVQHRGLLLDFFCEHQSGDWHSYSNDIRNAMRFALHPWVMRWDAEGGMTANDLARLRRMDDSEQRTGAAWQLFSNRGSFRAASGLVEFVERAGDRADATVMKRRLDGYLTALCNPSLDWFARVLVTQAASSAPGFEYWVTGLARRSHHRSYYRVPSIWLAAADAELRTGNIGPCMEALAAAYLGPPSAHSPCYVLGSLVQGTNACGTALANALLHHPECTPDQRERIDELFPEWVRKMENP